MINMGELQLVHALGLEIPSQKLLDRLGDQVLNPPRPRARIPLGPRNQLHQFYQGYPTDSDSDDDEDDEDDEDYDDYLMAAPNTVPAVPGQAIGPAIEGANWTVDGTGKPGSPYRWGQGKCSDSGPTRLMKFDELATQNAQDDKDSESGVSWVSV